MACQFSPPSHHGQQQSARQAGNRAYQNQDGHAFSWRSKLFTELLTSLQPLCRCGMRGAMSMKGDVSMRGGKGALFTCTMRQVNFDGAAMGDQHDMPDPPAEVCFNAP